MSIVSLNSTLFAHQIGKDDPKMKATKNLLLFFRLILSKILDNIICKSLFLLRIVVVLFK